MIVEKRKYSSGQEYYSIVYYDGDKKIRLKQSDHPKFQSVDEARSWAKNKEAQFDSMKARAKKRLEWKKKYYDFSKLTSKYLDWAKKYQPNSWKNTELYLYHYIFDYFLNIKEANNPNLWPMYFEEFKDWLEKDALTIRKPQRVLSYSSKNHCIKTVNTFLEYLVKNGLADPANIYKLTSFPKSKLNTRDADSLLSKPEYLDLYNEISEKNKLAAIFFQTCYFTGMRFNEVYGLSMEDLYPGKIQDEVLSAALDKHEIEYFGYIVLTCQPKNKVRKRLKDGSIERKPLKSKKVIHEKFNRIIPIIDKDLFNNLVSLYKEQEINYQKRVFGSHSKNYMLFDGLSTSAPTRALKQAYAVTGYQPKGFHCCRHTRATELVGQTLSFIVARYWLGHSRQETTDRYTHIFQQSSRKVINKNKKIDFI